LRELYFIKLKWILRLLTGNVEETIKKKLDKKRNILSSIIEKLGKTSDKKNIMTESKELFFDEDFVKKVDSNPYLICFKNCVVDFKEKKARNGNPEDYLTKTTGINYHPIRLERDQPIINEIEDFMHKLFPNVELYKYMWEHLASTLIGTTVNQTFNMYIGAGQNGKSVLVNLMEQVLGQYKGDVPLTLITQQRTKIGGVSPEIIQLKGTRYAVMQEPSKGDKINEGIMKQLSAGDALTGRAPFMVEAQTFVPQFTLVVCSNEFMEIKTQDHGTWRRIRVVDFESLFTENPKTDDPEKPYQYKLDKNIKEKFHLWKEVFASMLVDIVYRTDGNVEDCDKVMSSSNSYRKGQDVISEYLQERLESHTVGCITKGQLGADFKEWFALNYGNGKMNSIKDLGLAMDKRFQKNNGGIWKAVRFVPVIRGAEGEGEEEPDAEDEENINIQEL
jgi:P4 family phage/plasmid primase-like protien